MMTASSPLDASHLPFGENRTQFTQAAKCLIPVIHTKNVFSENAVTRVDTRAQGSFFDCLTFEFARELDKSEGTIEHEF